MSLSPHLKSVIAFLILACMALAAAQPLSAEPVSSTGQKSNSSAPGDLSTNAFIKAGCSAGMSGLDCSRTGIDRRFNCSMIFNASEGLDNLSPKIPMAECLTYDNGYDNSQSQVHGIIRVGCMVPAYKKYIVLVDGEFRSISTADEFKSYFAPVETPLEALSFAVALTDSVPRYDTSPPDGYFQVASTIEPTSVKKVEGGFEVRLFNMEVCGCGTHPYYAVDYLVTTSGDVTELSRQKVYDSSMMICMD